MLRRLALSLGLLALSGCAPGTMIAHNAPYFFRSPRPVEDRITQPVRKDARLAVLWIGHASALIQMDDKLILADPVFTEIVLQLQRRMVEPGLWPKDLPKVDATIISHLHPDHLSLGSLEMIEKKVGVLVVPEEGTVAVPRFSFDTLELPTWRTMDVGGLHITAVPVRHTGFRGLVDRGWLTKGFTGYVLEYHGLTVYFGGDSAYAKQQFLETRARFPHIDLALLAIAPKNPRSLMEDKHMDPEEALEAFGDLGAKWMVPIHHSTFLQSVDGPTAEPEELARLSHERGLDERVRILRVGEQRVFSSR